MDSLLHWNLLLQRFPRDQFKDLFQLYINDMTHAVGNTNVRLFADDTGLFIEVDTRVESASLINRDLISISDFANRWLITFPLQD